MPGKRRKYDAAFQGSQYTAIQFKDLVAKHGALQGMSRHSDCYDNARAESFWSCFKAELLDGSRFPGLTETRPEISYRIAYYNAEAATLRSATTRPTPSKPNSKQPPNSVRLS